MIKLNKNLFNIYNLFTRDPFVKFIAREIEFYKSKDHDLIGLIAFDLYDSDFSSVILSRDKSRQYRAEQIKVSCESIEIARKWLFEKLACAPLGHEDDTSELFEIFETVVKEKEIHPHFELLKNDASLAAAKEVLQEVSYHYKDIDGDFIDQFQSINGFDARIWELYLFCMFREEEFSFKRNSHSPDFVVTKGDEEIAVEAVIVARDKNSPIQKEFKVPDSSKDIIELLENDIPLKFGSSLYDKVKKKYWTLPHVEGKPFAIAIADFHSDMSMTWTFPAIVEYLYGVRQKLAIDKEGNPLISPENVKSYTKKSGEEIPSFFFNQEDTENVSAVIFSSTGTISKFNRLGKQAELGSNKSTILKTSAIHNFDKGAIFPKLVSIIVNADSNELWSEGISIFHNPNALYPIRQDLFPSVAHHFFVNEELVSSFPEIFPYFSINTNMISK